jgi:hypothetical protein
LGIKKRINPSIERKMNKYDGLGRNDANISKSFQKIKNAISRELTPRMKNKHMNKSSDIIYKNGTPQSFS